MRKFKNNLKKVVIKVGSSSITHDNGKINLQKIDELCYELANLENNGMDVVLVSSGAIAAGRAKLKIDNRPTDTSEKQAAAAVGQVALTNIYDRSLITYGYNSAQILLTRQIEKDKEMSNNARNTLEKLREMDVIPIINENDSISTYEIKFGDNDTLSAVIARLIDADLLIMLTDIEGLYTDDPRKNKDAQIIREVTDIKSVESLAKDTDSNVGTGGMQTKIKAAKLATEKGIEVVIASGENMKIIRDIVKGDIIGTYFKC
ncbi:glutamate 5-kinase [Peptoniphilus sp.]|jgi:glutamate 5-kinase|uniref:glutamate 5-kinase n=1 Tax=Peptoniphilus sp. TaxID=1971214 RepID=UPI003D8AD793